MYHARRLEAGNLPFQLQSTSTHSLEPVSALSPDLLKTIFALLTMQGLVNAAGVCKEWRLAAQKTPLFRFQKFQASIRESLALHLKPEQKELIKNGLEKAASLLEGAAWKSIVTGAILPELRNELIKTLQQLDQEHLENLDLMIENRFDGCSHLFQLAKLNQIINSEAYQGSGDVNDPTYLSALETLANEEPDGVLEIAKQQQVHATPMDTEAVYAHQGRAILLREQEKMNKRRAAKEEMFLATGEAYIQRGEVEKAFAVFNLMSSENFYVHIVGKTNNTGFHLFSEEATKLLLLVTNAFAERGDVEATLEGVKLLFHEAPVGMPINRTGLVLGHLATAFAQKGEIQGFLKVIDAIPDQIMKKWYASAYLPFFCEVARVFGHFEAAFEATKQISDEEE